MLQTWIDLGKKWALEALRLALAAAIGAVLDYALVIINSGVLNGMLPLTPEINAIIITTIGGIVKSADRAVHESDKVQAKGILPF